MCLGRVFGLFSCAVLVGSSETCLGLLVSFSWWPHCMGI